MSTTPPEQPPASGPSRPAYGSNVARMPIPGNAEFLLYVVIEIVFVLIWIIASSVNTLTWVTMTTALTFGYIISRGIAKAGKVLEQ
jgi:NADH:ubiquinone oxidoreductase subunit 3 (subunit A)